MSEQGIAGFRRGLDIVNAAGKEIYGSFLPEVQRQLGLSDTEFDAFVAQNYPHVAAFLVRAPEVVKYLNPAVQRVLAQGDNFHDADEFPAANLPVTLGPWSLLGLGLVLVGVGVVIRLKASMIPVLLVLLAGVGLLAGPLVLGWFHQTDAAEKVAEAARFPFSAAVANTTVDDTFHFDAAFKEMRQAMFPALAQKLGKSPAEMDTYLHSTFPDTMKFLDAWDATIYQGAHDLSLSQIEFMDEFHNADATPYRALPWLFMAPGLFLLIGGAAGFAGARRASVQVMDASDASGS
jgi:hypothetical protein